MTASNTTDQIADQTAESALNVVPDNEIHSGVGVLDKTVKILDALESGPATLAQRHPDAVLYVNANAAQAAY